MVNSIDYDVAICYWKSILKGKEQKQPFPWKISNELF